MHSVSGAVNTQGFVGKLFHAPYIHFYSFFIHPLPLFLLEDDSADCCDSHRS